MSSLFVRAALVVALVTPTALAAGKPVDYRLAAASAYAYGCQPPCLCPIKLFDDLTGGFELTFVTSTPNWFDVYRVEDVDWVLVDQKQAIHITGSGQYQIGGPVALTHRLQLDLSFDGGPVRHFDSGLVQGGGTFPELAIDIALNGFYCLDEVFTVAAFPLDVGTPYCTSTKNSTGERAHVRAFGSPVVADDDLTLVATDLPPGKAAVFLFGAAKAQTPFGDGSLCIAPPLMRIPPSVAAGLDGTATLALELKQAPLAGQVVPGTTWNFQLVFRDKTGGPAGFNLTDGLSIDFQ
jgi:hypothetical protein